jgi:hypothetical protein
MYTHEKKELCSMYVENKKWIENVAGRNAEDSWVQMAGPHIRKL